MVLRSNNSTAFVYILSGWLQLQSHLLQYTLYVHTKTISCKQQPLYIFQMSLLYFNTILQHSINNIIKKANSQYSLILTQPNQYIAYQKYKDCLELSILTNKSLTKLSYFQLPISNHHIYHFNDKLSILDLSIKQNFQKKEYLQVIPQQFLKVHFSNERLQIEEIISINKQLNKKLIFQSYYDEKMTFKIIRMVLNRQEPAMLNLDVNQLIATIFQKGNHARADLLIQDMFGAGNCATIGLPPKLIGASLGKVLSSSHQATTYDKLCSVLVALAINLGQQIKHQIFLRKTPIVLFQTRQFYHPYFLNIISCITAGIGKIYFIQNMDSFHLVDNLITNNLIK